MTTRTRRLALAAILIGSAAVRLHQFAAPMADSLQAKQAYVANRARSIARPPMNPLRDSLDFLDARGERTAFTDEIPLYHTLLAVGYRLAGERDWVGHALSLLGTLAALAAFFDLARRERGDSEAIVATTLLSACPLFLFYGRAVLPEPWMLAAMLGSAASYRRYLDGGRARWLATAALAGLGAALFKYFGLMVFLPLAEMARRASGTWRAVLSRSFLAMAAAILGPVALWMGLVFFRTANPAQSGWVDGVVYPYFIFQAPEVLASKAFWAGLFGRFLVRDCGPITAGLIVAGVVAEIAGRRRAAESHPTVPKLPLSGFLTGWTVMGLAYYVLLGPKMLDHDYYELMMLPAAALWATKGLQGLCRAASARRPSVGELGSPNGTRVGLAVLSLALVVQSPWISGGFFRQDAGKIAVADRLRALCPEGGRVVAIGPGIEFPTIVHYSRREGWPVHSATLPEDWRSRLDLYRECGGRYVAIYFEPKATAAQRLSYAPLLRALPVVEHHAGTPTRAGGPCEFTILALPERRLGMQESLRR